MDKCVEQWDTQALIYTTHLMLGSVCATLPDTTAYERVITIILWVLLRGRVSGGHSTAPIDVAVGFQIFRNSLSVPVTER
jgi:hypothetical protein